MPDQTARQRARRVALDAQAAMRRARADQERRRSMLALTVVTALAERDGVVRAHEARAGRALRALTEDEGLSLSEAVAWCGGEDQLSPREAARLRQVTWEPGRDGAAKPAPRGDPAAAVRRPAGESAASASPDEA